MSALRPWYENPALVREVILWLDTGAATEAYRRDEIHDIPTSNAAVLAILDKPADWTDAYLCMRKDQCHADQA